MHTHLFHFVLFAIVFLLTDAHLYGCERLPERTIYRKEHKKLARLNEGQAPRRSEKRHTRNERDIKGYLRGKENPLKTRIADKKEVRRGKAEELKDRFNNQYYKS